MNSEYRTNFKNWFAPNPLTNEERAMINNEYTKDNEDEFMQKKISNMGEKEDMNSDHLLNRYFRIHPQNDRTGFRKHYERVKDSSKTTYKEHFNGEGAYFPPLSTYVKAVNDLADIVETNEDEIKKQFSAGIKLKAEGQRDFMIDRKVDILKSKLSKVSLTKYFYAGKISTSYPTDILVQFYSEDK